MFKDETNIMSVDHILIRDADSGEVLVDKRGKTKRIKDERLSSTKNDGPRSDQGRSGQRPK